MMQEGYKNFRRNFLGHSIDRRFYKRNDIVDDQNDIHNAFDYGFICALMKIRYEISNYLRKIESKEKIPPNLIEVIEGMIEERIKSAYGGEFNGARTERMRKVILENTMRITDDF